MEKPLAAEIVKAVLALDEPLNRLAALISEIPDPDEKAAYVKALGNVFGIVTMDLLWGACRRYPELDPVGKSPA